MPPKKRKAVDDVDDAPQTRRSSGRVKKVEVIYDDGSEQGGDMSEDEFKDGDDSEEVEDEEPEDKYDSAASDDGPKKSVKQWRKGSNGREEMEIEIPQEKHPGKILYVDERIHQNTLDFLQDLKNNNVREWLKWHDKPFRQAEKDFHTFAGVLNTLIPDTDPTVPELPIKNIIFRIYRDIRFSPDPTPYKPYFSVAWSRTGRKGPYAHYYLHIQPNGRSFLGGGYWQGDSSTLACLRENIDTNPEQIKSVLMLEKLRKVFFPASKRDEKKIVAEFCKANAENALKTKPKGFDADHKDIALLKLRSFTLKRSISDAEITGKDGVKTVMDIVEAIEPFASDPGTLLTLSIHIIGLNLWTFSDML